MQQTVHNSKLDKWGIFWSLTCAFHCIALPFVAFLAPNFERFFGHEIFHWLMFTVVVPIAFFALWRPRKFHKSNWPMILGMIGLLFLTGSLFFDFYAHEHSSQATGNSEAMINITGSLFLVSAHLLNLKLHKKRCCEHDHHHH